MKFLLSRLKSQHYSFQCLYWPCLDFQWLCFNRGLLFRLLTLLVWWTFLATCFPLWILPFGLSLFRVRYSDTKCSRVQAETPHQGLYFVAALIISVTHFGFVPSLSDSFLRVSVVYLTCFDPSLTQRTEDHNHSSLWVQPSCVPGRSPSPLSNLA